MNALSIRCHYALLEVRAQCNLPLLDAPFTLADLKTKAYKLGKASVSGDLPALLNVGDLASAWQLGAQDASEYREYLAKKADQDPDFGTQEEWAALSDAERAEEWNEFHERCEAGVADDMYFYHVMMATFLVGYVGH